ncbi:head GIN domain-containing protein [Flavobacterium sp.]|uniref:head GIN domain-containing protein n=1 Tax=Flavobacterium sp. TaxID=239 RepID=UPI00286A052D|nr:head GIN domain-containing protein [Flavobacterium sp.]
MKKSIIVVFVLIAQINFAQITTNLGDFDTVKVFDMLNVKLIPANENKIVITGKRENEVEILNKNGELKIRMPFPKLLSGDEIAIKLYFKTLESIEASEGSYVSCDFIFKQTSLELNAKEGSEINISLAVEKVTSKANSGGIINLDGKATNQSCTITSGGTLIASELHTDQTTISVAAGGKAEIYATTLVDAKVKAGGSIYIFGKPKQINQETIFGGTIVEK